MSALTLASQDLAGSVAGPMAFSAGKHARPASGGEKAGDAFDAALALSENDAAAAASPDAGAASALPSGATGASPDAAAAPRDFARDGVLWRQPPRVPAAGLAATAATASAEASTQAPVPADACKDFSKDTSKDTSKVVSPEAPVDPAAPALDRLAKSLGSAVRELRSPAADEAETASAGRTDWKSGVPSLSRASGTIPSAPATPTEKTSSASKKTAAAPEAEPTAPRAAPRTSKPTPTSTPAADPLAASSMPSVLTSREALAKASVSGQTGDHVGASTGGAAEADSVARIGAALASISRRATAPGAADKSSQAADIAFAASDAASTSSVHVVARQTWLPPVSPAFSPGLGRQAAADRAELEAPRAASASTAESGARESSAAAVPAPGASAEPPAAAGLASSAVLAEDDSDRAAPAAKKPAAAPAPASAAPLAATPRRDLEITLAPKDLGGLAVRMKSAGDRLEIAFVADKGETARMIADNSATLESQLHGAGLGLGGIDINAASRTEAGAAATPTASAGASAQNAPADSRGSSESAPQRQDTPGRGRQDQSHENRENASEPREKNGDRGLYL